MNKTIRRQLVISSAVQQHEREAADQAPRSQELASASAALGQSGNRPQERPATKQILRHQGINE